MATVKIKVSVRTNRVGSEVVDVVDTHYTPAEWADLTDGERAEIIEDYRLEQIASSTDSWAEVVE